MARDDIVLKSKRSVNEELQDIAESLKHLPVLIREYEQRITTEWLHSKVDKQLAIIHDARLEIESIHALHEDAPNLLKQARKRSESCLQKQLQLNNKREIERLARLVQKLQILQEIEK